MPTKKLGKAKGEGLQAALAQVRQQQDLHIGSMSDYEPATAISTGCLAIDALTGVWGLPRGRIVELYGPPGCGKTTTALQTAARAQQAGGVVLYLDYEQALDPIYVKALGLDPDDPNTFLFTQPATLEEGINAARTLLATGQIDVMIVDSVASMVTEKELLVETGGSVFAKKAQIMAQVMRQLTPVAKEHDTLMIFVNHIQDVIDSSPMGQRLAARGIKQTTTPGGRALKYHASVRLEYKQVGNVKTPVLNTLTNEKEDMPTQTKVLVKVTKNKVGPPFKQAEVRVRFGKGFSQAWSVLDILVAHGKIKKGAGGVYTFPVAQVAPDARSPGADVSSLRGEENVVSALEADEEWLGRCVDAATDLLREQPVAAE